MSLGLDLPKLKKKLKRYLFQYYSKSKGDWPPFMRINFTEGCEIYNTEGELVGKEKAEMRCQIRVMFKFVKLYIKEKDGKPVMRCNIDLAQA